MKILLNWQGISPTERDVVAAAALPDLPYPPASASASLPPRCQGISRRPKHRHGASRSGTPWAGPTALWAFICTVGDGPTVPTQRAGHSGEETLAIPWRPQGLGGDVTWHQHPDSCFLAVMLRLCMCSPVLPQLFRDGDGVAAPSLSPCAQLSCVPSSGWAPHHFSGPWNGLRSLEWQLWIW